MNRKQFFEHLATRYQIERAGGGFAFPGNPDPSLAHAFTETLLLLDRLLAQREGPLEVRLATVHEPNRAFACRGCGAVRVINEHGKEINSVDHATECLER
jgi:hypothetical protein